MLPSRGSTRCLRAAGTGTDSRLPRRRFTNDRRPRFLTLPSIVRPPLSRFTVFSLFPPYWGIHLTGVRFEVLGHEPLFAGARGFRVGELAVAHESGAVPGPHRQPSTSESPATAGAGTWVPAEVGAASGEPPVDNHGVGQLRLHGYPSSSFMVLSGRPVAGTSVAPVRFDRHLSGTRTTGWPTAAQLAACAQRAAEPTAGCLGAASPTTADRGS